MAKALWYVIAAAALVFLFMLLASGKLNAETLSGRARVIDGYEIAVGSQRIRLWGVWAPELDERGGQSARSEMMLIIGSDTVHCRLPEKPQYTWVVAKCGTDTFIDIGAELIARGYALDCEHFSGGVYRSLEPKDARLRLTPKPYCKR